MSIALRGIEPSESAVPVAVVALAASAGGLNAVSVVLAGLTPDFLAAIVLVQHLDPRSRSRMAEILGRRTPLEVVRARDGDRLRSGTVFVAQPDRHLLVQPRGRLVLTQTDRVRFLRP